MHMKWKRGNGQKMKNHENKNLSADSITKEQSKELHIIQQSASL